MNKKIAFIVSLVFVITVGIIGCEKKEAPKTTVAPTVTPVATPAPAPEPAPAPKAPAPAPKPAKK